MNGPRRRWLFIALVAGAWTIGHIPKLHLAPIGHDAWRETDVLIVGRNYCEERTPFWLPKVDSRADTTGITGMEFPLLNWVEGQLACVGLDQIFVGRLIGLLSTLLATACIGWLASEAGVWAALVAAAAFAFSPIVWYFGIGIQPDMPSLALALLALVFVRKAAQQNFQGIPGTLLLLGSALCMSLGILIKLPVIVFGLPVAILLIGALGWKRTALDVRAWAYAAIALVPALFWYRHARHLQDEYGLHTFFLGKSSADLLADWTNPKFYRGIFVEKFFTYYAFGLFSVVAVVSFVWPRSGLPMWLRGMGVATLGYIFLTGTHTSHHFYYGLPIVPVLALAGGMAVALMAERLWPRRMEAALIVVTLLTVLWGRRVVRSWWPQSDDPSVYAEARRILSGSVAPEARAILFSRGDPKLFWFMGRKGWLAAPDNAAEWFRTGPRVPVLLVDRRAGDVNRTREEVLTEFRAAGYQSLVSNDVLDVWIPGSQGSAPTGKAQ